MSSDKGSAVTGVYVLDFSQEKPVSTYKISGDSVLDCKYLTSDTAVLVGSQASYIVKKGEKNYKTVSYEDKTLSNYCFNTDTSTYTMALSRSGDGRSVALISYNSNGEAQYTINTEHKADSLSVTRVRLQSLTEMLFTVIIKMAICFIRQIREPVQKRLCLPRTTPLTFSA